MVIWVIGLAGAGKTAVGRELYRQIGGAHPNTVFLDGDMVREIMGGDLGHTVEDRKRNAGRICRLCRVLDNQHIHVICAILSLFREDQRWNRENFRQYFEIYLRVSMETLFRRNQKGLYADAREGRVRNVVGMDIPFEPPENPDCVFDNDDEAADLSGSVRELIARMPVFI